MKRLFNIYVLTIALLVSSSPGVWAVDPAPPLVFLNTTLVLPTGKTIVVAAGGDFQAALNTAQLGDVITLEAGATFTGPFILPNKTTGTGWIIVRSSTADANLPLPGTRIKPTYTGVMPKIVSASSEPALKTSPGAHHFRFIGIEFTVVNNPSINYGIVLLGDGSSAQTLLSQVPHDLIIDRCYIHGTPTLNVSRGIELDSASTAIIDSYISEIHGVGFDTQAIAGWNGPGPFKIVNNYLEAAGENIIFGGATTSIVNLVPSDIEIRRNDFYKKLSWKVGDPSYAGIHWTVKNLLELKNAQRVLIDGNTFKNNWADAQVGFAILFTVRTERSAMPWAVVQDVMFSNNIVRHSASGVDTQGHDTPPFGGFEGRIKVYNNLFDDINGPKWGGGSGIFIQPLDGLSDFVVEHNTVLQTGSIAVADGAPGEKMPGFIYRNNIAPHNSYGITGSGTSPGNNTLTTWFTNPVVTGNVIAALNPQSSVKCSWYPTGNFCTSTLDAVGFTSLISLNYRLTLSSPYKNAGTDGKDIGVDIDAVNTAIAGILNLTPPAPPTGLTVQ